MASRHIKPVDVIGGLSDEDLHVLANVSTRRVLAIVCSVLLIAAMVVTWYLGVADIYAQFVKTSSGDVSATGIVGSCVILAVAVLGLVSRWNDSRSNRNGLGGY